MSTRIAELADRLQEDTLKIDECAAMACHHQHHSREGQEARVTVVDLPLELHQLLLGPALSSPCG